jgi:translocation and assembly module TamB
VDGSYFAFGQKLTIERGQLYFDGPIDNPGLDIVAVRKNLPVEAGVEVTGTVRIPRVRLISNPPVSDGEKLAWLVTGRGLENASSADIGLLQAAAGTLINSNNSIPLTRRIARQMGLDDIGVHGGGSSGALDSQVLTVGKRLSRDLYLEYEQGLAAASNVLRLNYQLTRALSLRVEAGAASAFGLYYRRSYE